MDVKNLWKKKKNTLLIMWLARVREKVNLVLIACWCLKTQRKGSTCNQDSERYGLSVFILLLDLLCMVTPTHRREIPTQEALVWVSCCWYIGSTLVLASSNGAHMYGKRDPKSRCCRMGTLERTSWLYLRSMPLLILSHDAAPLMLYRSGECSKKGPFFTCNGDEWVLL